VSAATSDLEVILLRY